MIGRLAAALDRLHPRQRGALLGLTAAAVVVRIWAATQPGHGGDLRYFMRWAHRLDTHQPRRIYDVVKGQTEPPDHLPPDIFIHHVFSHVHRFISDEPFTGPLYMAWLKSFPNLADLCLAVLALLFFTRIRGIATGILAYGLVLLWPPLIITGPLWGQWDSMSMLLIATGAYLAWRRPRFAFLGVALAVYAIFIKPPLIVVAAPVAVVPVIRALLPAWRRGDRAETEPSAPRRSARPQGIWRQHVAVDGAALKTALLQLGGGVLLGLIAVNLVASRFRVSIIKTPTTHGMGDLVRIAADKFPYRTLNAPNLWAFFESPKSLVSSTSQDFLFLSGDQVGLLLYAAFAVLIAALWVMVLLEGPRTPGTPAARRGAAPTSSSTGRGALRSNFDTELWGYGLWAGLALTWGSVFFMTRAHERYIIPSVIMSLAVALLLRTRTSWGVVALLAVSASLCLLTALSLDHQTSFPLPLWYLSCVCNLAAGVVIVGIPLLARRSRGRDLGRRP